jgi:hypothetical protein
MQSARSHGPTTWSHTRSHTFIFNGACPLDGANASGELAGDTGAAAARFSLDLTSSRSL